MLQLHAYLLASLPLAARAQQLTDAHDNVLQPLLSPVLLELDVCLAATLRHLAAPHSHTPSFYRPCVERVSVSAADAVDATASGASATAGASAAEASGSADPRADADARAACVDLVDGRLVYVLAVLLWSSGAPSLSQQLAAGALHVLEQVWAAVIGAEAGAEAKATLLPLLVEGGGLSADLCARLAPLATPSPLPPIQVCWIMYGSGTLSTRLTWGTMHG